MRHEARQYQPHPHARALRDQHGAARRAAAGRQRWSCPRGSPGRAQSSVILQVGIYVILAVSLNIATGYLGQLPLGHAGFMAVGAYAGAIFWKGAGAALPDERLPRAGARWWPGWFAAVSRRVLIGIPALRLKGDYLAIITLGFGEIIRVCIINLPDLTGGTPGLMGIPKYATFTGRVHRRGPHVRAHPHDDEVAPRPRHPLHPRK